MAGNHTSPKGSVKIAVQKGKGVPIKNGPQACACGPPGGLFGLTKRWSLYVPRRGDLPRLGTALKRGHFYELRV
jgi:hypothetical protein